MGAKLVAQWTAIKEMAQKRVDLYKKLQDLIIRNNPEGSPLTKEMIEKDHRERIDSGVRAIAGIDMMLMMAERIEENGSSTHTLMTQKAEETRERAAQSVSELEVMYDMLCIVTGEGEPSTDTDIANKIGLMFDN